MKIIDVLNKKGHGYHTVQSQETLDEVLRRFIKYGIGSLVVNDDNNNPIGVLTERSVIGTFARMGEHAIKAMAGNIMLSPAPSCRPNCSIREAMSMMTMARTRHLIVSDAVGAYGIVSLGDLVSCKLEDTELENLVLKDLAVAVR